MNSRSSTCDAGAKARAMLSDMLPAAGVVAWGVAEAALVDEEAQRRYSRWIECGYNASMKYMEAHVEARMHPSGVLEGTRTVVVAAFNYFYPDPDDMSIKIARYARGRDYHEVVRERLGAVVERMKDVFPDELWRVVVDTAPLRERYWAQRAGVGFVGMNNLLIVPGTGSWVVLGEIVTTLPVPPDSPCTRTCGNCGRCVKACPGGALSPDGGALDARRCLSYLTIEHRGTFPNDMPKLVGLAGCDICQQVCPHNVSTPCSEIEDFSPASPLLHMSADEIRALSSSAIKKLTRHSALSRIRPEDFRRNLDLSSGDS